MALACNACRVAAVAAPVERPDIEVVTERPACRDRARPRSLPVLAQRIAELERRVDELRSRS